jgi:hypothetical protein
MPYGTRWHHSLGFHYTMMNTSNLALFYQSIPFSLVRKVRSLRAIIGKRISWRSGPRLKTKAKILTNDEGNIRPGEQKKTPNLIRSIHVTQPGEPKKAKLFAEKSVTNPVAITKVVSVSDLLGSVDRTQLTPAVKAKAPFTFYTGGNRQHPDYASRQPATRKLSGQYESAETSLTRIHAKIRDRTSPVLKGPSYIASRPGTSNDPTTARQATAAFENGLRSNPRSTAPSAKWNTHLAGSTGVLSIRNDPPAQAPTMTRDARLTGTARGSRAVITMGPPQRPRVNARTKAASNVGAASPLATIGTLSSGQAGTTADSVAEGETQNSGVVGELWLDVRSLGDWILTYLTGEITRASRAVNQIGVPI